MTRSPRIGLVLGAGGLTGFGYHAGALASLQAATGWDPRTAEVIVGTSAGSGIGALIRGGVHADDLMARMLSVPANPEAMARLRSLAGRDRQPLNLWFGSSSLKLAAKELARPWQMRPTRLGLALLPAGRVPTGPLGDRARALHGAAWPDEHFWACAVDLQTGDRVVFGKDGPRTEVGSAVEASSAIPVFFKPVTIEGRRYIDGAVHSPTNADLVADLDLDLVVVVSPMSVAADERRTLALDAALRWWSAGRLGHEIALLLETGTPTLVIEPLDEDLDAMGPIAMDPTRVVPTLTRAASTTLRHLDTADDAVLEILDRAARTASSPADVPYPTETP